MLLRIIQRIVAPLFFTAFLLLPITAAAVSKEICPTSLQAICGPHPDQVKRLTLDARELRQLGHNLGVFKNLVELNIQANCEDSETEITYLPEEIANLKKLKILTLGATFDDEGRQDCYLHIRLPKDIGQLTTLKVLSIDDALAIDQPLPDDLGSLKQLEKLRITRYGSRSDTGYYNGLSSIPSWVEKLKNLRDLNFDYGSITALPDYFGQLENLETISLRVNNIHTLPASLAKLPKLKTIHLGNNHLTAEDKAKLLAVFPKGTLDFESEWDE